MSEFTKGPWKFNAHDGSVTDCTKAESEIAIVSMGGWDELGVDFSNANLIACAPEMYEMLESTCGELWGLINEVNKQRLISVNSQTETPPDLYDMESCHLIQRLLKRARGWV